MGFIALAIFVGISLLWNLILSCSCEDYVETMRVKYLVVRVRLCVA
jgi:hypothetical protein